MEEHSAELPVRNVRDPQVLRALAHPARIRLLEELAFAGPSTATDLAERVGESPAHCSWHLRQLARYGFVAEAGGGRGRQRPWRIVVQSNEWPYGDDNAELALAGDAAAEVLFGREYEALRQWRAASHTDTAEWKSAPFVAQSMGWLTAEELTEVGEEVTRILMRYLPRLADPASRPDGARPVRLVAWGIPARASAPDKTSADG